MASALNIKDRLNTPVEEAYKVLRTNIQFCSAGEKIKTITITSCASGEGKTTTSINLAVSMAKAGAKVLLIDADLRKPMLLKHLSSNLKGLSNLISGTATFDEVINSTNVENFYYISCGPKPPNPVELLGSERFIEKLGKLEDLFDTIIIDTPPLGSVIDCAVIASKVDATLIVVKTKSISLQKIQRVKEQLDKVNARVLGVVLNRVSKGDYSSYYSYYDYFGEKRSKRSGWFKRLGDVGSRDK